MIFSRLVDLIRFEAGMPGSSTATAFIEETVLECLRDLTAIDLYQELLVVDASQAIISNGQTSIALPTTYQHLRYDRVRFLPAGSDTDSYFLLESEYFDLPNDGTTSRYQLSGRNILLFPNNQTAIGDVVKYDYYNVVVTLLPTDTFPVPALEPVVKKTVLARVKRMIGKNADGDEVGAEVSLGRSKGDGTTSK